MKKNNFIKVKSDKFLLTEKRNYFLGSVALQDISKIIGVKDQKVYFVRFEDGARTKIHYHEGGQILVVTDGQGMLVLYKKNGTKNGKLGIEKIDNTMLRRGDIVYIPKKTLHWHGAIKKKNFAHIAFNSFSNTGKEAKTIWFDSDFVSYARKIK